MTRHEFQLKEANMAELAEIFRRPVFRAALDIVKAEGFPNLPDPVPGVDYGAQVASHGSFVSGWQKAIRSLETLSLPSSLSAGKIPIERQYHDAAKQKMREAGVYTEEEISSIKP